MYIVSKEKDTMQMVVCSKGYKINYKNNKIWIRNYCGTGKDHILRDDERIEQLNIIIRGENNEIYLEEPIKFSDSAILIEGNNNKVSIASSRYTLCFSFLMPNNAGIFCNNRSIEIGKDVYLGKLWANVGNEGHTISIGSRCLLAEGCMLRTVDGHTIYDNDSLEILNEGDGSIELADHVWLGSDVKVLKGTKVSRHTIVAAGSILTKKYDEERCVLGGIPAKIVKRNVNWSSMNTVGVRERFENPERYKAFFEQVIIDRLGSDKN